MSEVAPPTELLRSLGRLVRGLSALFWGLPLTLIVCVKTAMNDWLKPVNAVGPVLTTGLILFGVWQLGYFQKQERIWMRALDRAKLLAIVNVGLSPFLYWWNKLPYVPFYLFTLVILTVAWLVFLLNLNLALQRLAAMLPDETLRLETRWFTSVNFGLLIGIISSVALYLALKQIAHLPPVLIHFLQAIEPARTVLLVFLVLLPLALTMTLLWKIKEVILHSVFSPQN